MLAASEPASGSLKAKQPSFLPQERSGRYFSFCPSVPKSMIGLHVSELCAATIIPVEATAFDLSSMAII